MLWVLIRSVLEVFHRDASNVQEYSQPMLSWRNKKKYLLDTSGAMADIRKVASIVGWLFWRGDHYWMFHFICDCEPDHRLSLNDSCIYTIVTSIVLLLVEKSRVPSLPLGKKKQHNPIGHDKS